MYLAGTVTFEVEACGEGALLAGGWPAIVVKPRVNTHALTRQHVDLACAYSTGDMGMVQ